MKGRRVWLGPSAACPGAQRRPTPWHRWFSRLDNVKRHRGTAETGFQGQPLRMSANMGKWMMRK
jgi:hypothetical protein